MVAALAAAGGMATRETLLSAGVPGQALSRAVAAGVVCRVARGVYATAPPTTWPQRAAAALLLAGPDALLSHVGAAWAWGCADEPDVAAPIDLSLPHSQRVRGWPRGLVIHRSRHHVPYRTRGWPVTSPEQTAVDVAASAPLTQARMVAMAACHQRLTTPERLRATRVPRGGVGAMRLIVEEAAAGAASGGEAVYWRLIVDSGLPVPQLNVPFTTERGNYVLDAWWRDWDLAAEIDGRRHHVDAFEADRVRQNELHAAGLLLIRFPVAQVLGDPQEVLRITELALSQRGWRPTTRRS